MYAAARLYPYTRSPFVMHVSAAWPSILACRYTFHILPAAQPVCTLHNSNLQTQQPIDMHAHVHCICTTHPPTYQYACDVHSIYTISHRPIDMHAHVHCGLEHSSANLMQAEADLYTYIVESATWYLQEKSLLAYSPVFSCFLVFFSCFLVFFSGSLL